MGQNCSKTIFFVYCGSRATQPQGLGCGVCTCFCLVVFDKPQHCLDRRLRQGCGIAVFQSDKFFCVDLFNSPYIGQKCGMCLFVRLLCRCACTNSPLACQQAMCNALSACHCCRLAKGALWTVSCRHAHKLLACKNLPGNPTYGNDLGPCSEHSTDKQSACFRPPLQVQRQSQF